MGNNVCNRTVKNILAVPVILSLALLVFPSTAFSCSCVPPGPVEEDMTRAKAVFVGQVVDIKKKSTQFGFGQKYNRVDVHVTEHWKGIESNFVSVATAQHSAACGFNFDRGERYLIFAYDGERFGEEFATGICNRTTLAEDANKERAVLGPGDTTFSDTEYIPGYAGPVRETIGAWIELFITKPFDAVLSQPPVPAFGIIALYLAVPVTALYWLLRRLWKGKGKQVYRNAVGRYNKRDEHSQ